MREGSFALGAGKMRTIFKIVLPSALPGIMSAIILAMGRVVSESAPFMYTMGSTIMPMPKSYMSSGTTPMTRKAKSSLFLNERLRSHFIMTSPRRAPSSVR